MAGAVTWRDVHACTRSYCCVYVFDATDTAAAAAAALIERGSRSRAAHAVFTHIVAHRAREMIVLLILNWGPGIIYGCYCECKGICILHFHMSVAWLFFSCSGYGNIAVNTLAFNTLILNYMDALFLTKQIYVRCKSLWIYYLYICLIHFNFYLTFQIIFSYFLMVIKL